MKNQQVRWLPSVMIALLVFSGCEKEPDAQIGTKDNSALKVYAGATAGHKDGPVSEALFEHPILIATGPDGSFFVVDGGFASAHMPLLSPGKRIRKITPGGIVSTFFDIATSNAGVNGINGIAINKKGDVYISDGDQIKKISADGIRISLVAGTGTHELMKDGPAMAATFYEPSGLAFDKNDCLYIIDTQNNAIRFYSNGKVSTIAGGDRSFSAEHSGTAPVDGNGFNAEFDTPQFLALGNDGHIYVSGGYFPIIRKVTTEGEVTTIVRNRFEYESEELNTYRGLAFHPNGALYLNLNKGRWVRGTFAYSVSRVLLPDMVFTELAANEYFIGEDYPYDDDDGYPSPQEPGLNAPTGMVIRGNTLYICNTNSNKIFQIDLD